MDSDLFLDWLRMVKRVFDYKDISDEKNVKLVALRLPKYASICWANLVTKSIRKGKGKICTWAQMRDKLKAKFLPPITSKITTSNFIILNKELRVWRNTLGSLNNSL